MNLYIRQRIAKLAGLLLALIGVAVCFQPAAYGHGTEARYYQLINWKSDHIAKVFSTNQPELRGMPYFAPDVLAKVIQYQGRSCLYGEVFVFDVDDDYGFDIDEPVNLSITYASSVTTSFLVGYDMNGGTGTGLVNIKPDKSVPFPTATITLNRARFAGQAAHRSDFAFYAPGHGAMIICDMKMERSFKTKKPTEFGTLRLSLHDAATNISLPARVGIYDATGRAPLPSDQAVLLQRYSDDLRLIYANERNYWPSQNRLIFYVDGTYETKVPVGTYEIDVGHGLEYRFFKKTVEVKKNAVVDVDAKLERWVDMPAQGWHSGDDHVHLTRDTVKDDAIWAFTAGEDINVTNLLEMGNIIKVYFDQPKDWDNQDEAVDETGSQTIEATKLSFDEIS